MDAQEQGQVDSLRAGGLRASGIAHDIQQSLALISAYAQLAERQLEEPRLDRREVQHMLNLLHHAALTAGATLSHLLSQSERSFDAAAEAVPLRQLLVEVSELTAVRWRDAAQATGREIRVNVRADASAIVLGCRATLLQAFTNLILNAVDALPEGGTITLRARRCAESVEVEVADTGTGMPPEVRDHAFEPFFTTKGTSGHGLGLAQVFRTVDWHGGSISVRSSRGRGTTFRLTFPPADTDTSSLDAGPESDDLGRRPLRVLVVDDEPALARLCATVVARAGHVVATASSGEAALDQLEDAPVDVVVSDLSLNAALDGWAFARCVKARWPNTTFVLVTGWEADIEPRAARAAGVDAVISKPYRTSDLRSALRHVDGRGGNSP